MADLPVLMLTAKGQAQDRSTARDLGATEFMTKPFSNAEVVAAVRRLTGRMNEDGNDLAERAFLRRKREDAAFAVPMLGVILLASPLLNVVSGGTRLWVSRWPMSTSSLPGPV